MKHEGLNGFAQSNTKRNLILVALVINLGVLSGLRVNDQ